MLDKIAWWNASNLFQKCGKFWIILLGHFIKHKPLISEDWSVFENLLLYTMFLNTILLSFFFQLHTYWIVDIYHFVTCVVDPFCPKFPKNEFAPSVKPKSRKDFEPMWKWSNLLNLQNQKRKCLKIL